MSPFVDRLNRARTAADSLVCVGLDPDLDRFPEHLRSEPDALFEFNRAIIEHTSDLVSAYKLNIAFFEVMGSRGYEALERTLTVIPDGVVVICDCKRGDMGNSARMYAKALFEHFGFDAVTVNPYQGRDSVQPFLDYTDRGVFILCLTSNESAREFQYLSVNGHPLYLEVASAARSWNTARNAGPGRGGHSGGIPGGHPCRRPGHAPADPRDRNPGRRPGNGHPRRRRRARRRTAHQFLPEHPLFLGWP